MALFSETRGFVVGFSVGFGTGLLARELLPAIGRMVKPASKRLMRTGITLTEKLREGMANLGETMEDLAAEVNLDLKHEKIASMTAKRKKKSKLKKKKDSSSNVTPHGTTHPIHERNVA